MSVSRVVICGLDERVKDVLAVAGGGGGVGAGRRELLLAGQGPQASGDLDPEFRRGGCTGCTKTTGSRVQGCREVPVGNAQAWYYPEDRVLVLWECFLDSFVRDRPLEEDEHMSALWAGFEKWLLQRYPGTERIVTPWADPLWDSSEYQAFLTARRYTKDKPGMFIKLLN